MHSFKAKWKEHADWVDSKKRRVIWRGKDPRVRIVWNAFFSSLLQLQWRKKVKSKRWYDVGLFIVKEGMAPGEIAEQARGILDIVHVQR